MAAPARSGIGREPLAGGIIVRRADGQREVVAVIFIGLAVVAFLVASAGSAYPERKWGPSVYWIASAVSGVFVALGMPTIKAAITVAVFTWVVSWFYAFWWTPLASRKGPDGRRKPGFASRYSYWPPRRPGTPPPRINRYSKPHYQSRESAQRDK